MKLEMTSEASKPGPNSSSSRGLSGSVGTVEPPRWDDE